jgi:ricin-type beta-trefoil lectin protein
VAGVARQKSQRRAKYAPKLWTAQAAVNALRAGTVTSSLIGTCLGYASDRRGTKAETANCDTRTSQIWRLAGSTLRTPAGLCLAATSSRRTAPVELARCTRSSLQVWQVRPGAEVYNAGARRCLADPVPLSKNGDLPGIALDAAACIHNQGQGWFEP